MSNTALSLLIEYFSKEISPAELGEVVSTVVDQYAEHVCCANADERPPDCKDNLITLVQLRDVLLKSKTPITRIQLSRF